MAECTGRNRSERAALRELRREEVVHSFLGGAFVRGDRPLSPLCHPWHSGRGDAQLWVLKYQRGTGNIWVLPLHQME